MVKKQIGVLFVTLALFAASLVHAGQGQGSQQGAQPAQGQGGQAGQAAAAPRPTKEQFDALQALQNELDPDRQIQMVEDFEKKYPGSPVLTDVYFFAAVAYQQKGKLPNVIDYGERSLKANPDNLRTLLMMSSLLPQPQALQGSDADKDKKLAEAETDADKALQLLTALPKPPNQTDDQFQKLKASLTGGAHASLGMVHLERAQEGLTGPDKGELTKAEQEYQAAIAGGSPDAQDYYRLGEAYSMDSKIDEAIDAFSKASQASQGSPLQAYADKQVEKLKQAKSQAKAPTKP